MVVCLLSHILLHSIMMQAKHATPAIALSASMNVPVIELAFWGSKHYYLGAENSFTSGNGDFDAALGFGLEVDKLACALVGLPVELRKRFTEAFGEKVVMISKHQLIKAGAVSWHEGDGGKGSVLHVAAMKPLFVRVAQNGGLEVFQGESDDLTRDSTPGHCCL